MEHGYVKHMRPFFPTVLILIGWFLHPFGRGGDFLFFVFSLITLIGGTFYAYKVVEAAAKENEALRIKQLLSYQRHDWMNDVQVILGYLSLHKTDRMKNYLEQHIKKANDERLLTQLHYPPLVVSLITLPQRYLQWRITSKVTDVAEYTLEEEKWLFKLIDYLFPWLDKQLEDIVVDVQMHIQISKKEEVILLISVDEVPEDVVIRMHDLDQLRKTIRRWRGELFFDTKRNEMRIVLNSGSRMC